MTSKERRKLKHDLKTRIDYADTLIVLSDIGASIGVNANPRFSEESKETREATVNSLLRAKEEISENCEKFIAEIDKAIEKMQ